MTTAEVWQRRLRIAEEQAAAARTAFDEFDSTPVDDAEDDPYRADLRRELARAHGHALHAWVSYREFAGLCWASAAEAERPTDWTERAIARALRRSRYDDPTDAA